MTIDILDQIYTVRDAAKLIGVTTARIRQICIKHDIGRLVGPARLLNGNDLAFLQATKRKSSSNSRNISKTS